MSTQRPGKGWRWCRQALPLILLGAFVEFAGAQCLTQTVPAPFDSNAPIGDDVQYSQGRLLVGSARDDRMGTDAGAGYIYVWVNGAWQLEATLLPPNASGEERYAMSVALSGPYAALGGTGGVQVYELTDGSWDHVAHLHVPKGAETAFGESVALDGTTLVVAERFKSANNLVDGVVHVYEREAGAWTLETTLSTPNDSAFVAFQFGWDVDVKGDRLIVSAKGHVYIFERKGNTWIAYPELVPDPAALAWFINVEIEGDIAIAGVRYGTTLGSIDGAVHSFERSGPVWVKTAVLPPPNGADDLQQFGRLIDLRQGRLAVASIVIEQTLDLFAIDGGTWVHEGTIPSPTPAGYATGIALVPDGVVVAVLSQVATNSFYAIANRQTAWQESDELMHPVAEAGDDFGFELSAFGSRIAVLSLDWTTFAPKEDAVVVIERTSEGDVVEAMFSPAPAHTDAMFRRVALQDELLAVAVEGAFEGDPSVPRWVEVFRRERGTWVHDTSLLPPAASLDTKFGEQLAWANEQLCISDSADDEHAEDHGVNAGRCCVRVCGRSQQRRHHRSP